MDKPDDMKQILEILRLETLQDVPLPRLSEAIKENLSANVDKRLILDIYTLWLRLRLIPIDVSAKGYLGLEFFYLYHFLKALPGDDSHLADAFYDWQCRQAVGNSIISTKFRIAEAEFRRLAPAVRKPLERSTDSSIPEDRFGRMHPDRAKLSQETRTVIELDEDKDDDDIIFVSSNSKRGDRDSGKGKGSDGRPGLSFLTGSNMLPVVGSKKAPVAGSSKLHLTGSNKLPLARLNKPPVAGSNKVLLPESNKLPVNGKAMITHEINSKGPGSSKSQGKPVSKPKGAPGSKSATSSTPPQSKVPGEPQKLHREYVCSRCKMKGDHVFKDCPILDPSFDKKLPKGYICRLCMKNSDHHVSVCPLNMDPESVTQRRLASVKHNGPPSVERRGGPRKNQLVEARNRSRSPPRELDEHIAKDTQGPQKETSSESQARAQRRSRKRKAAPSPPTPRKKGTPALEMGEIRENKEIGGDLMVSPNLKVKEPFKRRLVSYADEVEETREGNSRTNDRQLFELISSKTGKRARDLRRNLKKRLMSYADEVDETHENNSHVNDRRKRKASPSLPTSRKKNTPAMEMREIREIKETSGDPMVSTNLKVKEPFKRRLVSYADKVDETHESHPCVTDHRPFELTSRKTGIPAGETRRSLIVSPNLKVKELFKRRTVLYDDEAQERHKSNSRVNNQLFELAVLELIRVESVKTDLLRLDFPSNPFSAFSLKGQVNFFRVNETANEPRPHAVDFYDLCDDDEQLIESIETEMPTDMEAARNYERAPVLGQEMADLTMALAGLANPAAVGGEDTAMAEHGPETAVVASTDAACSAMLTTGSFHSEQSPIADLRMEGAEAGISIQPTNDGLFSAKSVAREGVSTTMTEEPDQVVETGVFPDQFVTPEAIDAMKKESLSPHSVDESVVEVDVTTTATEKLSATSGEPVKVVADVDTEMTEGQLSFDFEPAVACDCDM